MSRPQALRHKVQSKQQELAAAQNDLELTVAKEGKHRKELGTLAASLKTSEAALAKLEEKNKRALAEVEELQRSCDAIEDKIFAPFSKSLGVASVRDYEDQMLRQAKEQEAHLQQLKAHQAKLRSQLQFEHTKDLPSVVRKLKDSVANDAKALEKMAEKAAKAEKSREALASEASAVEAEVAQTKAGAEEKQAELKALKKTHRSTSDEIAKAKAKVAQLQAELEQARSSRQRIFARARMEECCLPLLDDETAPDAGGKKRKRASGGGAAGASSAAHELLASESFSPSGLVGTGTLEGVETGADGSQHPTGESSEELVRIDFTALDDEDRSGDSQRVESDIAKEIDAALREQGAMAPNMKAIEQFDEVQARLHSMEGEWDVARTTAKSVANQFLAVHAQRTQRFLACWEVISAAIDTIYADLTRTDSGLVGTAYLSLEDQTDPFLHGVKYNTMPPGKRFRDMDQLSGGERTVAAIALLMAIHKFRPSPFFVMDEVDAALDNVNVTRVAKYIRQLALEKQAQFIVISLKDNFYEKAYGLVGVYRDRAIECSRTVTLDLEKVMAEPDDDEDDE